MSADNWAVCPKCNADAIRQKATLESAAKAAYGKIPAEQYLEWLRRSKEPINAESTLREDYEMGVMVNGEFFVAYGCYCTAEGCGFKHEFRHSEIVIRLNPPDALPTGK